MFFGGEWTEVPVLCPQDRVLRCPDSSVNLTVIATIDYVAISVGVAI